MNSFETLEISVNSNSSYCAFLIFGHHNGYSSRSFGGFFFGSSTIYGIGYNSIIQNPKVVFTENIQKENQTLKIKNNDSSQFMVQILSICNENTDILTFKKYIE